MGVPANALAQLELRWGMDMPNNFEHCPPNRWKVVGPPVYKVQFNVNLRGLELPLRRRHERALSMILT